MSRRTEDLRDIFLDVSDEPTLTESQEEGPSRDPIGRAETEVQEKALDAAREDGLDDAVDDGLGNGAGIATG